MGCAQAKSSSSHSSTTQPSSSSSKKRESVRSVAQLEYELSNCYDLLSGFSDQLESTTKAVAQKHGRELKKDEYLKAYNEAMENSPSSSSAALASLQDFFDCIREGMSILPLLNQQSAKIDAGLPNKHSEIAEFKKDLNYLLKYCTSIKLPIMSSHTTDH